MKRLILTLILMLYCLVFTAQDKPVKEYTGLEKNAQLSDIPFTERYGGVARGNITFIANNILNRPPSSSPYNEGGVWYTANNYHDLQYIDIDGDPTTFSSSSATLNLPTCSKVVYAGLYWAGIYPFDNWSEENGGVNTRDDDFNEIKFRLPGGNYIDLVADKLDPGELIFDNGSYAEMPYVCYKDVTSLVAGLSNPNGDYYAANIKATLGMDNIGSGLGSSAGWNLVVVYENENESSKKFYVFDGFSTIRLNTNPSVDVPISGFQTIPTGPVRATLLVAALEGDSPWTGDSFQILNPFGTYSTITTGTNNPTNNFFNSSITAFNNHQTNRNPASQNTLGYDADIFALNNPNNSIIQNNQTSTTLRFTTAQDSYWPFLLGMAVEIIEPKVQLVKTVDDGAGNDIAGQTLALGAELWYNVQFQNVGTDNATDTQIVDVLPKNVDLIETDIILPPGITTYNYDPPSAGNSFRGVLTIDVPDSMVTEGGAAYDIRFKVQVVSSCNDLRDVCSNIVENQAFANYSSDLGGTPRVENEPSVAGLDNCNFGIDGSTNFLADTSGCTYERDEVLCGSTLELSAGSGFISYEWRDSSNNIIGTNQTVTVSALGTYTVTKVAPVGCISTTEIINVIAYNTEPNPLVPFADIMYTTCTNNTDLAEIYLCGDSSSRTINLPFDSSTGTTVTWQKLDESSCPDQTVVGCANIDTSCTWNTISTAMSLDITDSGEYRVEVLYDGRCPTTYYFNVFKASLNPTIVKEDMICGSDGQITVNGVPAGYEYSLSGPNGYFVDFQASNTFTVSNPGDYDLQIRITNASAASCSYDFGPINILNRQIDLDLIPTHIVCSGDTGSIRVQVNNVPGDYTYTLLQGGSPIGNEGPTANNDFTFNVSSGGNYQVRVTTADCSITEDITINEATDLTLTAAITKNISCLNGSSDGIIQLTGNGGTLNSGDQYTFAVWTSQGTDLYASVSDIPPSEFFTANTYNVANGNEGIYRFVVIDSNNCSSISNPVDIVVEAPLTFTPTVNDISCSGETDGSISVAVNGSSQGYLVEYNIDAGSGPGAWNTTGNFTALGVGTYTINIRASKPNYQCFYTIDNLVINDKTAITSSATITQEYTCLQQGEITFGTTAGGTPPYSYGIDGVYSTNPVKPGLTEGTYALTVRDANNCITTLTSLTIDPLPTEPTVSTNIEYNCDGTGNITVSPNTAGYTYSLNGGTAQTSNVFTNVAIGTHTITVDYGRDCTTTVNVNVIDNGNNFSGTIVGSTDSRCFNANNGTATISASNYVGGDYEYSINGGTDWLVAIDNPFRIVGLPAGTHNILIRDNSTTAPFTNIAANGIATQSSLYNANTTADKAIDGNTNGIWTNNSIAHTATGDLNPFWQVDFSAHYSQDVYIKEVVLWNRTDCCGTRLDDFILEVIDINGSIVETYNHSGGATIQNTVSINNWGSRVRIRKEGSEFLGLAEVEVIASESLCIIDLGQVTISEPPQMNVTADVTDTVSCIGIGATITVTATGGVPPYTFSLDGVNWQTSNVFTDVPEGTYTIQLRDSQNCDECGCTSDPFVNGSFEEPIRNYTGWSLVHENDVPGWDTTAADNRIEIWHNGFQGVPASEGNNFAELNANAVSTLYQEYCTQPGDVISWSLDHRGRLGTDVAQVRIGGDLGTAPVQETMSDGNTAWGSYSGTYTVPVGQPTTIIAFEAVSTAGGNPTVGNFIDNVNIVINKVTCTPVTVVADPPQTIEFTATPTACYSGSNDGEIAINVTQGNDEYQFILNGGSPQTPTPATATNYTFSGLGAGTYTVDIVDGAGCTATQQTVTINEQLTATAATTNVTCNDGNLTITASGGDGNYQYAIITSGSGTTPTYVATNSFAITNSDDYDFFVQDGSGCSYTSTVNVGETTSPSFTTDVNQPACNGDTGSINVTISDGVAPYTIAFTDNTTSTTTTSTQSGTTILFDSLTSGTYTVQVTDANNCTQTPVDVTINALTTVASTASITQDYTCTTLGQITFTAATGGSAPYTYGVNGVYNTDLVYDNLTEGTYTLTVQDNNGCISSVGSLTIDALPVIPDFTSSVSYNCDGGGNITLTPPATPALTYSYSLNGGVPQPGNSFDDQSPGTYTITVTADRACPRDFVVTVDANQEFRGSILGSVGNYCNSLGNGKITIEAENYVGDYQYSIDGGTTWLTVADSPYTIYGLDNGTYDVWIRELSGAIDCPVNLGPVTIDDLPDLQITASVTQPASCEATNSGATITASASGGLPPYQYSLDGTTWQTSPVFTDVDPAGSPYDVYVQDSRDCSECDCLGGAPPSSNPPCNPGLYQVISFELRVIDPVTGDNEFVARPTVDTNAISIHPTNYYIYGMTRDTHQLFRMGYDGVATVFGAVTHETTGAAFPQNVNVCFFDETGNYLWLRGGGSVFYRVDINTRRYTTVNFTGGGTPADMVFIDGKGYGITNQTLYIADMSTNPVSITNKPVSGGLPNGGYGSMFTVKNGDLYAFNNNTGRIYRIDNYDGPSPNAVFVDQGTPSNFNDGASCPEACLPVQFVCVSQESTEVTVDPPAEVIHTATATTCFNGSNGEIVVNVTQGVQDYLFRIDGGPWIAPTPANSTTHTFTGLTAGNYDIEVQDALGCISTLTSHTINEQLTATASTVNVTCNDGSLTITAAGGDGT
ncbi:DUF6923 family protein, partial [Tenacibaculum xiamenense]|uniref:DUF6923 family protein n=1 Tax=Tenacibaculum xiamenense TaxID=1261553 RepID=UPI0038B65A5A